jgi:methylase of polypeptide subunit release factors
MTVYAQGHQIDLLHSEEVTPTVFSLFLANSLQITGTERWTCDLGTGGGILAITMALLGVERVVAIDHSALACELAEENARRNGVAARVEVIHGDLTEIDLDGVDLAVSNPPTMPAAKGTPGFAAGGGEPLGFVRLVAACLDSWLSPAGGAQIGISSLVAEEVLEIFRSKGLALTPMTTLLAPFRPFYARAYEPEDLERFLASGRALSDGDPEGPTLSEFITTYSVARSRD